MTVKVKEFVIHDFTRAQADLHKDTGDFLNIVGLLPATDTPGRLKRAPAWSSIIEWPSSMTDVEGIFYDYANGIFVFIGQDSSNQLASANCSCSNWSMSGPDVLVAARSGLGGLPGRNVCYFDDTLYLIADDDQIYSGADYSAALASFDTDSFNILTAHADRFYAVNQNGSIERLNDACNALEAHWTANCDEMDIQYLTGYRGYLYAVAINSVGNYQVV